MLGSLSAATSERKMGSDHSMNLATRILTSTEVLATAFWTGASAGFSFVSAPLAFSLVEDRDLFASLTEGSLDRLAACANVAGSIAVTAAALRRAPLRAGIGTIALSLVNYHQKAIVPAMTRLQRDMGSFHAVADDDPQRIAYREMHQTSTRVFGAALLLGIAQLVLAAGDNGKA
jgi:hypothetical protein